VSATTTDTPADPDIPPKDPVGPARTAPWPEDLVPVVVVNDTRPDRHYGCLAVMEALSVFLPRHGMRPIHFQPLGRDWQDDPDFAAAAANAAAIIVNGEGSMHHNKQTAIKLAWLGPFCRQTLRIPGIMLNTTLEANDGTVYDHLRHFSLVAVRDRASIAEPLRFGLADPFYCPDFSMFHDFRSARTAPPARPPKVIGYTDSVLRAITMHLRAAAATHGMIFRNVLYKPPPPARAIYHYARNIGALDLLVTGRYHACCYAIATGTPFVAVESNTGKITNLLNDVFGSTRRLITPEALASFDPAEYAGWTPEEEASLARFVTLREQSYDRLGRLVGALAGVTSRFAAP
jgi:hypothetical protein